MTTKLTPEIKVIPIDELEDTPESPENTGRPWKLYIITALAVLAIVLVNVCAPANKAFHKFGVQIHSFGILGPLLFLLFNGLIIIPLALPYMVFEMTIAFLIQDFLSAICFSMVGKLLGATISYIVAKYALKQRIRDSFKGMKVYKGIEHVMQKNPIKFSLILRIIVLPLFLKNYGLAVPDSVDFKIYMLCTIITTIPTTAFNIYIFQEAGDFVNVISGNQPLAQKAFSITMVIVSVSLMIYLVRYTKRLMKELEGIKPADVETTTAGDDMEVGPGLKLKIYPVETENDAEIVQTLDRNEIVAPQEQEQAQFTEEGKNELDYEKIISL